MNSETERPPEPRTGATAQHPREPLLDEPETGEPETGESETGEPETGERGESPGIVLGFARGIAPSKWERRWREATGLPIELRPVAVAFGPAPAAAGTRARGLPPIDVMLERTAPGARPAGSVGADRTRHALRLYGEAIALVVPAGHALAKRESISPEELASLAEARNQDDEALKLLDHPDHAPDWPAPEPWADPAWRPANPRAALRLVAAGTGGILLPLPLARHLTEKREHALVPVHGESPLAPTEVWATWEVSRDGADVQQLVGILRGRTARSSRPGADAPTGQGSAAEPARRGAGAGRTKEQPRQAQAKKKAGPKPGTRGAQLANAKWKPKPPRPKPKRRI